MVWVVPLVVHDRPRRLLVHKKEILELKQETERAGYTIVPLRIYLNEVSVCWVKEGGGGESAGVTCRYSTGGV